jgi:hypothetical protein
MNKSLFGSIPFIPGAAPARPELLARHLPPIQDGVVSAWLQRNAPPGSWILDPFGASPHIALEAAQAGYRVLVAANNPIIRFLLEMIADPPSTDQLKASLAELAASFVGEERIEPHIRSLYNTICARCGQLISADAFLWEHGNPTPYARIYTCPYCGDSGEHHSTSFDAEQSSKFISSGLHKARALERVVAFNDQDRIHVEQALSVYSPRALYGLITIINKLQGLNIPAAGQKHLSALLLYAFDQVNSMWRPQAQSDRRRQLTIPRHSRENNIWCALEEGINRWSAESNPRSGSAIPVTIWPDIPPATSGICIYEGRMISLVDSVKAIDIESVCTALPRPNQAYWTLSALWAGWLWGREAVGTFKSVLHRQRYDWAWHATALASVFKLLANFLKSSTPILGLIGEAEPGFIGSTLVAAGVSGCQLESMALRPEEKQAQIIWKSKKNYEFSQISPSLTQIANQSARRYLELNAEPASYLSTISAALIGIINHWSFEQEDRSTEQASYSEIKPEIIQTSTNEPTPSLVYSSAYNSAREALSYRSGFLRYTLTDETNIEAATKSQNLQTSLFALDTENIVEEDDDGTIAEGTPLSLIESISEKQRPTRSSDVSESTFLWLREIGEISGTTSSENNEAYLVRYLISHPGATPKEIDQAVCAEFPGLLTPEADFIRLCLASYGLTQPQNENLWFIRPEDDPNERLSDIARINVIIHQIGTRLDFICTDKISSLSKPYVCWQDQGSGQEYWFFITSSAAINEIVNNVEQPLTKGFIVIPASRTNLLIFKLRRDPRLNKAFNPSLGVWQFLKFRHLRSLSESPLLNRDNLEQMLSLDPLTFTTPQLWLI